MARMFWVVSKYVFNYLESQRAEKKRVIGIRMKELEEARLAALDSSIAPVIEESESGKPTRRVDSAVDLRSSGFASSKRTMTLSLLSPMTATTQDTVQTTVHEDEQKIERDIAGELQSLKSQSTWVRWQEIVLEFVGKYGATLVYMVTVSQIGYCWQFLPK